jgi:phage-related protein
MEIIIPENNKDGQKVSNFLKSNFTDMERVEVFERMETCEKFSILELIQKHKIEKLTGSLYELRIPIAKTKLRFFGVVYKDKLMLIHVFKKKTQQIPKKELKIAKTKASLLDINNY